MPLDPQFQQSLARIAASGDRPIWEKPVDQARADVRKNRVLRTEDRAIPGPDGQIPVRIFTPPGAGPMPGLVYLHGGGWVTGDLDTTDQRARLLAEWVPCVVVSVDYRMAPEHKFPAALDDSYAATVWVAEHAADLGIDPGRLGVGGDSAGGNLGASVCLKAREQGGPALALQYLAYPVTDSGAATRDKNADGYGLSKRAMEWYDAQYFATPADAGNPLGSPLRAPDLRNLPPALVVVAGYDPLHDEGLAYANRLKDAGNQVEVQDYPTLIHGFFSQGSESDAAKLAIVDSCKALRDLFKAAGTPGAAP